MPRQKHRLTPRQAEVLDLVHAGHRTSHAIASELGIRQQGAGQLLIALQERGLVARRPIHDGTRGRPAFEYRPAGPAGRSPRLQAALERACDDHPMLAELMANPNLPVADPTVEAGTSIISGPADRHAQRLPELYQ